MPQFILRHPDDPSDPSVHAVYGVDPARGGLWADVPHACMVVKYDALEMDFDHDNPLLGILGFLCEFDYLDGDAVDDALVWLDGRSSHREDFSSCSPGPRRRPPRRLRGVLRVISNLRAAGR